MDLGRDWMAAFSQDFFIAVIVIGDLQARAKIELADVCGGEWIFASALAALERLRETLMFTHKIFRWRVRNAPQGLREPVAVGGQ